MTSDVQPTLSSSLPTAAVRTDGEDWSPVAIANTIRVLILDYLETRLRSGKDLNSLWRVRTEVRNRVPSLSASEFEHMFNDAINLLCLTGVLQLLEGNVCTLNLELADPLKLPDSVTRPRQKPEVRSEQLNRSSLTDSHATSTEPEVRSESKTEKSRQGGPRLKNAARIMASLSNGPKTLRQIVEETGIEKHVACNALKVLRMRGSIERYTCIEDGRAHSYVLTGTSRPRVSVQIPAVRTRL